MSFIEGWVNFFKGLLPPILPMEPLDKGHLLVIKLREIYSATPVRDATVLVDGASATDPYGQGDYCVHLPTGNYRIWVRHVDYHDTFLRGPLDTDMIADIALEKRT